jgi:hypothetical protein
MTKDEYIKELEDALEWIIFRADQTLDQSEKLRSDDARQIRRIADRAEDVLESKNAEAKKNHEKSHEEDGEGCATSP